MKQRKLIIGADAVRTKAQHTQPCSDCPWARDALPGWLGSNTIEQWLEAAHGESLIDCHTMTPWQCAGAAIYRANVAKRCRTRDILALPPDAEQAFTSPQEFINHHKRKNEL